MAGCLLRLLLSLTVVLVLLPHAYAFGAGDIPDYAYLNDKAFRRVPHGDIENILMELNKSIVASASGGAMGLFLGVTNAFGGGPKFSKMDVKRVYFGNWLRDFSQAMDIAGLSRITADTIVMVVMALGFLTFGFATEEFEVTPDRLGVYLPVEHIDNPKGYGEKEGDARRFHPSLRPPVNPRELEIDEQTGMKKYIANETGPWDTSTAHVRRTIESCITYGRRAAGRNGPDMWEAYRLLGTALHTLEDLTAHSNWCELAMRKMGYNRIFCHVGDAVLVKTPLGPAPPLVTGTFGSTDFLHSLLGEATDQLRQASLRDLTKQIDNAKAQNGTSKAILRKLHAILEKLPSSDNRNEMLQQAEEEQYKIFHFDPDDIAPETVQKTLWRLLEWRDKVVKDVVGVIEKIPGLESLLEEVTNTLNAFVLFVLEPWLTPILEDVTQTLQKSSEAIINTEGQYEVFDDPYASDPTHSLLSKDHFSLILNEPAGRIAMIVVRHTVERVVRAWYDPAVDVNQVSREILDAFHHPYFARPDCVLQSEMFEYMQAWIEGMDEVDRNRTLASLDKVSRSRTVYCRFVPILT
ncbi:hypothetical protein BOTBODRAFT_110023 [Botryobasidium botryosum FD-172 SS1]|uniref:Heterokaryon incompatibility Het-C n=1 Tax=Botryobasidium botryosum (strain FD-172 SS1) TaxID=930990 RepID=A0A067MF90_BOTB1|nr:hypothetical protein BOTBODRAFT_110023 [Botryobasidium botryosum FD-172 SS1]